MLRNRTGEDDYERRDRRCHTDRVRHDNTGTSNYVPRIITGNTDYTLKGDRTGDAEVESLLGSFPRVPTGDLIDLSSDTSTCSIQPDLTGNDPMSRIPRSVRELASPPRESIGLGISMSLRKSISGTSLSTDYTSSSVPLTPDLAADFSDVATQSSGPSTPPSLSPPSKRGHADSVVPRHTDEREHVTPTKTKSEATTPTGKARTLLPHDISIPEPLPADSRCAHCSQPLFSKKDGGKFVTVPEQPSSSGVPPKTYHTSCFRCTMCDGLFEDNDGGRAVFVRGPSGACHVEVSLPASLFKLSFKWHKYSYPVVHATRTDDRAFVPHPDSSFHGRRSAIRVIFRTKDRNGDIPRELAPLRGPTEDRSANTTVVRVPAATLRKREYVPGLPQECVPDGARCRARPSGFALARILSGLRWEGGARAQEGGGTCGMREEARQCREDGQGRWGLVSRVHGQCSFYSSHSPTRCAAGR